MSQNYAYAAYRKDIDWLPISSISSVPDSVQLWINETYVSYEARSLFEVVKIILKPVATK